MEEDKGNPRSQTPSPLPGWLAEQALSGQGLGTGSSSGRPLSDTEEEGAFASMEEEQEYDTDRELSQWGDVTSQELCLWEEMTVQEFYQQQVEVTIQEVFPCGVVRCQEWHQLEVGVRAQWGDGPQQELEMFHWEESVTVQELSQWDEEDETYQELSQLEEDLAYQELSLWEGEGYQELCPLEEDVRGHLYISFQWEGDQREQGLSQVEDNRENELTQAKDCHVQQLPQWEKDGSNQKLSQWEESVSSQGLSQWAEGLTHESWDKPLHPEKDEDAQTCGQQGPGSPSSVGTQVAAEAAPELPSASPALGIPTEDELAAAAALIGAAEEVEEPPEPLAPEVEKAPGSPARSEEVPLTRTESPVPAPHSPPGCSQALLDLAGHISSEVVHQAVLEVSGQQPEEQEELEQSMAAELEAAAPGQREESPISAPHSPCFPPSPSPSPLGAQVLGGQQEEADRGSVLEGDESEEGALSGELEHSQCKDEEHTELSQGEINKYQEGSQGEACTEQELPQAEASRYQEGSKREACSDLLGRPTAAIKICFTTLVITLFSFIVYYAYFFAG